MMGNVVLRWKLPHPVLMEFSWLMELQSVEVFLYSPQESLPVLNTVGSRLGSLWNRTEMTCQFNLEQADEGYTEKKSNPQI
jgi:hypothetical protein